MRGTTRQGDTFLLGADIRETECGLPGAYHQPLGVTIAFNRNLLVRTASPIEWRGMPVSRTSTRTW